MSDSIIITRPDLSAALARLACDREADGAFRLGGPPLVSFMGAGDEFVVSAAATYYTGGAPFPLAPALAEIGTGLPVQVF